jgi:hypothetical protein
MTPPDHLHSELLHCAAYTLTDTDQAAIDTAGIEAFIYAKLTSKKFRKWAVDESSEKQAKQAIHVNISEDKPLLFRYPFGGYKLWRMPGSPEVDWAEFFSIAYYCKYLAPIAAAYKPGIAFAFASDDVIIERMDNIPTDDTNAYFDSFKKLLGYFGSYFPDNFAMDIFRIGDLYQDKNSMEAELADKVKGAKQAYDTTVSEDRKKQMYTTSALNINWDGAKDLTKLSDDEKQAFVQMGPIYHDAYCALSKRKEFNRGEDKIVLFTTVVPNTIAIGTTKSTITKFWTGFGALQKDSDSFRSCILSPKQLQSLDSKKYRTIDHPIAEISLANFNNIRLYDI